LQYVPAKTKGETCLDEDKATFPAPNAQPSALWRIAEAICQRREFYQTQILAKICLNMRDIWRKSD
jgi:hypothetical protein